MPLNEEGRWRDGATVLVKALDEMEKAGTIQSPAEKCGALMVALMRTAARKAKDKGLSLSQFKREMAMSNNTWVAWGGAEYQRLSGDAK